MFEFRMIKTNVVKQNVSCYIKFIYKKIMADSVNYRYSILSLSGTPGKWDFH